MCFFTFFLKTFPALPCSIRFAFRSQVTKRKVIQCYSRGKGNGPRREKKRLWGGWWTDIRGDWKSHAGNEIYAPPLSIFDFIGGFGLESLHAFHHKFLSLFFFFFTSICHEANDHGMKRFALKFNQLWLLSIQNKLHFCAWQMYYRDDENMIYIGVTVFKNTKKKEKRFRID